jgi:taurine dioxygenase
MALTINPLSDALGAEVAGLDTRSEISKADLEQLNHAFLEHHLLCIRSVPLSASEFARVARNFGEPQLQLLRDQRTGEAPEVSILESTYKTPEAKPDDLTMVRLSGWHTDDSYFEVPAKATALQGLAIPSSGGQTRFSNTRRAYDELPDAMREKIDRRQAIHAYDTRRATARARALNDEELNETKEVVHPLVRTHEDSGKRAIYFNPNRTDRVVDMDPAESDGLLDALHEWITKRDYQYHHEWTVGDILLWDNRCLVHSVNVDFPVGEERRHQRILLKGTRPV